MRRKNSSQYADRSSLWVIGVDKGVQAEPQACCRMRRPWTRTPCVLVKWLEKTTAQLA
ncbi:hypothetical protein EI94DRAFT_1715524 [Lactarius quietus]|nr:hypothetical protein EI94DRAFT_1715524 [Lactarius quietus]